MREEALVDYFDYPLLSREGKWILKHYNLNHFKGFKMNLLKFIVLSNHFTIHIRTTFLRINMYAIQIPSKIEKCDFSIEFN